MDERTQEDVSQDEFTPLSVLDIAIQQGLQPSEDGTYSAEGLLRHGFTMIGGCQCCYATIAVYNAYPSKSGYWMCGDCISDYGFNTLQDYTNWKVQNDHRRAQYNEG